LLSTNAQLEQADGSIINVVPRGAAVLCGGTAEKVKESIERLFEHMGRLLQLLRETYEKRFGRGSYPGPDPKRLGTDLLGEGCLLLTDTCNTARATRRCVQEMVAKAVEVKYGAEAWAALSSAERDSKALALNGGCWQHMRNIFLDAMTAIVNSHLKSALEDSLEEFSPHERMSPDCMQLIRAAHKQFHHGEPPAPPYTPACARGPSAALTAALPTLPSQVARTTKARAKSLRTGGGSCTRAPCT
jgi:hypothetical protein